jgi:galactokinase
MKPNKLAEICQLAEQRHAGVQCGIMDQYAVACAMAGHALLIDCRSLETRDVPVPAEFGFIVVDSGLRHRHPEGRYNDRASECSRAVILLAGKAHGLGSLREADTDLLDRCRNVLGDVLYRRCRHVVSENQRVLEAVAALREGALARLGALLTLSHGSLRDDYEVSCPEVDALVDIASGCAGVAGARMMGGGFGGCVLVLAAAPDVAAVSASVQERFAGRFGRKPWLHRVTPAPAAGEASPR